MNGEWKYILKACFILFVLVICFFVIRFCFSHNQTSIETTNGDINTSIRKILIDSDFAAGKILFRNNCAPCHMITGRIEGPRLIDIEKRVTDKKLLYAFIKNSDSVIKAGNPYFSTEYVVFNKTNMSSFPDLSDKDIHCILYYIKVQTAYNKLPVQ